MCHGKWLEAEDSVAKLRVACEQAALDGGDFQLAWLLTHMAEPPWARLLTRGATLRQQQFGRLSDPAWVATAIGYLKDVQAVQEMRKCAGAPPQEEERRKPPKKPKREPPPARQGGPTPK